MTGSGEKAAAICEMPSEFVHIKTDRIGVARHLRLDLAFQAGIETIELEQGARMHADHSIDDELESSETYAAVWDTREVESSIGIADVHHDLDG